MTKQPKKRGGGRGGLIGGCSKVAHEKLQHARRQTRRLSENSDETSGGNKTKKKTRRVRIKGEYANA